MNQRGLHEIVSEGYLEVLFSNKIKSRNNKRSTILNKRKMQFEKRDGTTCSNTLATFPQRRKRVNR